MTYDDLIKHFGSEKDVALAVNVKPPSVYGWVKRVPDRRQLQIHKLTGGKLKADPAVVRKYRDLIPA